jgi:SAM-dependent methyltransferase
MTVDVKECYDQLADHYDLIFENWEVSITRQAGALAKILERECGPRSAIRILDCACGIGTQTIGLLKLGFTVAGCDVSSGAVARAKVEAQRRGLAPQLSVADMLDLSSIKEPGFDAVICMDNVFPHLESDEQITQAAAQIHSKLRPGGLFMASIRDYDDLIQNKPVIHGPAFHSDEGRRRIVFQVWDWIDDRRYVFHLYITRETATGWQTIHATSIYRAILQDELAAALNRARFKNVRWVFTTESGFYQRIVLAEADKVG